MVTTLVERYGDEIRRRYVPGVIGINRLAKEYGISATTIRRIVKPGFAERNRYLSLEAKRRRTGICKTCGGITRYNGVAVSAECAKCTWERQHEEARWPRDRIIQAIQEWATSHNGEPPSASDWRPADPSGRWPAANTVYCKRSGAYAAPFDSWASAIEAAGYPRPSRGRPRQAA